MINATIVNKIDPDQTWDYKFPALPKKEDVIRVDGEKYTVSHIEWESAGWMEDEMYPHVMVF